MGDRLAMIHCHECLDGEETTVYDNFTKKIACTAYIGLGSSNKTMNWKLTTIMQPSYKKAVPDLLTSKKLPCKTENFCLRAKMDYKTLLMWLSVY